MERLLTRFFADVSSVCGHEANLHANFMHHLLADGVPAAVIEREYQIAGKRIDLVLAACRQGDTWVECGAAAVAFEFKGGAYNTRNALYDAIDADGYNGDLDKLAALRQAGLECWFVCTDMTELGIALSPAAQQRIAAQCARRGIHFAYYAQDQSVCLIARAGVRPATLLVQPVQRAAAPAGHWRDCLPRLGELLAHGSFTEDTAAGAVYHALQRAGFHATQVSLETYFNCAKAGGRMQDRPDICVFNERVDGRFNLYRRGDRSRSNDGIKIGNLQALIEIKGSNGASRASEKAFIAQIAGDIGKLAQWRARFAASGYLPGGSAALHPDYVMIAVDNRKEGLAPATIDALAAAAASQALSFHYLRIAHDENA